MYIRCSLTKFVRPAIGFAFFVTASLGAFGQSGKLVIATGTPEGAYHRIGSALADALDRHHRRGTRVVATDGSLENMRLVHEGAADFGLIQGALQQDMSGLLAVARLDQQLVHVVTPPHSGVVEFNDIAGRRLGIGPAEGGAAALGELVLEFCGYTPAPEIVLLPWEEMGPALREGRVDAAFLVYSMHADYMERLLDGGELRLVPILESQSLAYSIPSIYPVQMPPFSYGPNRTLPRPRDGGFPTLAVDTLLIARSDAPRRDVRDVLQAAYHIDTRISARLATLTEEYGRKVSDLPLHPAADDYYRRNDPISSDSFEIASFFLAGVIAVVGTVHYLIGFFQGRSIERRRRAIVPFFEKMLEFAEQAERTWDIDELTNVLHGMMAAQRDAEKMWLRGDLNTEHMENLYSVYNIRCRNTFSKIHKIQYLDIQHRLARLESMAAGESSANVKPAHPAPPSEASD